MKEYHVIGWCAFSALFVVIVYVVVFGGLRQPNGETRLGPDFSAFYIMGKIYNEYPPVRIYDLQLQEKLFHELRPGTKWGAPNPYPPYVGLVFGLLARLPYLSAYLLWSSITVILYLLGIGLILSRFEPLGPYVRSLVFCGALSYYPFLLETLFNGQLSAVGFFALALAIYEDDRGHPYLCGIACSICAYKPTLLVLVLPFLFLSRRYRALLGFLAGIVVIFVITTALMGVDVWGELGRMLYYFSSRAVGSSHSFNTWKYLDLTAFSKLLPGGHPWIMKLPLLAFSAWILYRMVGALRREPAHPRAQRTFFWAAVLNWTMLFNVYVPIYDSLLAVLGVILTAALVKGSSHSRSEIYLKAIVVLLAVCPWFTQELAQIAGFQLLSIILALLGLLQLSVHLRYEESTGNGMNTTIWLDLK